MRELYTSGSVGAWGGNPPGDPTSEAECTLPTAKPTRHEARGLFGRATGRSDDPSLR